MAANNPDQEIDPEDSEELPVHPVTSEPSAVIVLPARELQSQIGFENVVITEEEVDSYVITFDELGGSTSAAKSTVSLRVSRGKSQVNLTDPSRIYRRGPPERRIFPDIEDDEPGNVRARRSFDGGRRKSVKFNSEQNVVRCIPFQRQQEQGNQDQSLTSVPVAVLVSVPIPVSDQLFPAPRSEQPLENVKSEYDFFKSGQTLETVLGKVQKLRARMQAMADKLKLLSVSCKRPRPATVSDEPQAQPKENPTENQQQTEAVEEKDEEVSTIIEKQGEELEEEIQEQVETIEKLIDEEINPDISEKAEEIKVQLIQDDEGAEPSTGTGTDTGTVENPISPALDLPGETDEISDSVGTTPELQIQDSPTEPSSENTETSPDFQRRPSRLLLKDSANKNTDSTQSEQDEAPD